MVRLTRAASARAPGAVAALRRLEERARIELPVIARRASRHAVFSARVAARTRGTIVRDRHPNKTTKKVNEPPPT